MNQLTTWLPHIKDIANIAFFLTTGIVAVLTYMSAKKTILQPIRTEVFKEQLKEFSKTLELFYGKNELALRNEYAIEVLIKNNITIMVDSYASLFFGLNRKEEREFNQKATYRVTKKYAKENFKIADDYISNDTEKKEKIMPHESTKHSIWMSYHHGMLWIPEEFEETNKKIESLINNPLLPQKLIDLLEEYRELSNVNAEKIREIIEESSREMPTKYVNEEQVMKFSYFWILQKINRELVDFSTASKKNYRIFKRILSSRHLIKKIKVYFWSHQLRCGFFLCPKYL